MNASAATQARHGLRVRSPLAAGPLVVQTTVVKALQAVMVGLPLAVVGNGLGVAPDYLYLQLNIKDPLRMLVGLADHVLADLLLRPMPCCQETAPCASCYQS